MWILRFHLLQTKDYNKLSRICKKHGFKPRRYSVLPFCKSLLEHCTQKTSWRTLGRKYNIDHISLYKFHEFTKKSELRSEIFHVFLNLRICLYIGDATHISGYDLDNSEEIYNLTKKEFRHML